MYLSTFKTENINDEQNLIIKSLFILVFISPTELTNNKIKYHQYKEELESIRYNTIVAKYSFLSLVNPPGWNYIAKSLPEPENRRSLQKDFLLVEMNILHEYVKIVNVMSNTIGLN